MKLVLIERIKCCREVKLADSNTFSLCNTAFSDGSRVTAYVSFHNFMPMVYHFQKDKFRKVNQLAINILASAVAVCMNLCHQPSLEKTV